MASVSESTAREQLPSVVPLGRMDHHQTCSLHRDEGIRVCWVKSKEGEPCTNNASTPGFVGAVPTCEVHHRLGEKSSTCAFKLPCGFQCGRICVFKIHAFHLCPLHRQVSTPCYLTTKIPIELRQRILRYLLPAKPISAHESFVKTSPAWLEILRTNRQFHKEGTQLFYGTGPFVIEISTDRLSMCYAPVAPLLYNPDRYASQKYRRQILRLGQYDKEMLIFSREQRERPGQVPRQPTTSVNGLMSSPPPLTPHQFSMIRSIIINIIIDDGDETAKPNMAIYSAKMEKTSFDLCDHLQKLVGRLQLQPLTKLQVAIRFGESDTQLQEALRTARILLQPFRRLRNIDHAGVLSITIQPIDRPVTELLHHLPKYLHEWSSDLKSSTPFFQSPIFEAYWQLEDMVRLLKQHYRQDNRLDSMDEYLHRARVARENGDRESFGVIWGRVVDLWVDYLNYQKEFQENVAMKIDRINGLLVG
ncbi:hypothetical protein ONS95_007034 [Cadophora gregata]|uniref:uncharacterized protein n=1 Tax=Cadophora gregata TaxID=51156 RepID=UPI0026DBFF09|nr:uncharacterized protein ONS95_007034 [Cadophora gregata]KAK0100576.1 hypothetical protein ONS95_007034 [Cadophora gregata]KAK0117425.1 hypothetical protein ONS96_013255 [Cadophora gregata f. sp. sojae]